ncbi:hypothetical protein BUALT_Bualt12G0072700 [Buddleja alternifolia]|uniref:protein-serine/threonine phosphatase n=1 Tax=Buddleja alternifolia TaxID=168488 RepID=A0AAV6WW10_9LAMI|nr:hypothetical protein BUALT_Bualt12G0072700 [Buddleja alternifolia]
MFSWLEKSVSTCLGPLKKCAGMDDDHDLEMDDDALIWSNDLGMHSHGEFSFAVAQANAALEDHSQVETGPPATFVGVYDGHGGPNAAIHISNHLFQHLLGQFGNNPLIAAIGSCCLVGVICGGTLYVANLGDSRAVMGCLEGSDKIVAVPLTNDHNAKEQAVRRELRNLHHDDANIVVKKKGVYRVKGIIQVSRAIGDFYLKNPQFALDESFPRFHLTEPLQGPVLSAEPAITTRNLQSNDKFIIFASDGLWEYLTNKEAVEIVHKNPRLGIAKRLLMMAMKKAAKRTKRPYNDIKILPAGGERRKVHDDITIVVIFIDPANASHHEISVRGFDNNVGASNFTF